MVDEILVYEWANEIIALRIISKICITKEGASTGDMLLRKVPALGICY